ncbi:hypothetical protein QN277_001903 [Acacia crassicarpa]|uniref:TIR domain-containing protein n=1 Tax=Acacia crassicarpa TaxID=499986 RepID=A0AAE1THA7_9FABA|nr:hypothetical protein QN277_001903 [Acacia crassicarpa]
MEYLERRLSALKPSHVYISFDDDDDTHKFVRSLSAALKTQGFRIFGHYEKRETGVSNNFPYYYQLIEAIEESWIWIVVFSKNYASSFWCLRELEEFAGCREWTFCRKRSVRALGRPMVEERETRFEADIDKVKKWRRALTCRFHLPCCRRSVGERTIAVYYDVDPNSFPQQAYLEHSSEERQRRLEAVKQVTSLSAWPVRNYSSGTQVIQKIVKEVKSRIDKQFYDFFGFVGIQSQVEEVEKLLNLRTDNEVQVVGICGMAGLGKSTIAAVLYLKIFHCFDAFCFLPNVSERLRQGDLSLQEFLRRNFEAENSEHILGQKFLASRRSLIVVDGVDLAQHLQELNLVEKSNYFGAGSRIIITTRDEQVLQEYEVNRVYRPKLLLKDEAFKLFCSIAFPKEYPTEDFKEMIDRVLEYADGLPLAIEILGSSFYGKGIAEWRNFLDREEIIPPVEIIMVLRKCFDELDDMSKEMFLDVACFFVGNDINYVKEILHDCISCSVDEGIKLLIQKSIITIANQRIKMHGMLQVVGRDIVRRESPNQPELRHRLYLYSDIKHVMEQERDMVINDVEAIALDLEEPKTTTLRIDALSYMINLRLLIFRNVKCFGTLDKLSSELRYVSWHQYPFTGLPSSFQSSTLVQLIMPESNMTEVWRGRMMLPKLRKMNLCGSKTLTKTPDFGGVPNLERLELEGCTGLLQLDSSISKLSKLKFLNLRKCINLVSIPNSLFFHHNSLEVLNLAGCSKLACCLKFSPVKSLILVEMLSIWRLVRS